MDESIRYAAELLPFDVARAYLSNPRVGEIEELRIRAGKRVRATLPDGELEFPIIAAASDVAYIVERASDSSLYAVQEELRAGFVTSRNGVRVGVCGRAAGGALRDFTSANVRVPRDYPRAADEVFDSVFTRGRAVGTLIVSPPGVGKTTLLRALIRRLSDDAGLRVSVADERGELTVGHETGERVDALTFCPKSEAVTMLARSMSPQVVALDELTSPQDADALLRASGIGAAVIATAHGRGREVLERPAFRALVENRTFGLLVTLRSANGKRISEVSAL